MEIISWIGLSQSLFAAILMLAKKNRQLPDVILITWLFFVSFDFLGQITGSSKNLILQSTIFLIYNPLLYFYTVSLTKKQFEIKRNHFLHIIPFIAFLVSNLLFSPQFSISDFWVQDRFYIYRLAYSIVALISFFSYSALSIIRVHKHRINLKNEFSSIESNKNLSWLLFVLVFYVSSNSLIIISSLVNLFSEHQMYPLVLSSSALLILAYAFGFYGLKQKAIYQEPGKLPQKNKEIAQATRYQNSRLKTAEKEKIKKNLLNLTEKEKPYLDGELTIHVLARRLKISRHILTEILNNELGKNFYQFINEYRIEQAKKMLTNKSFSHLAIESIGFDCGFNSKSTFFTVFKSFTGLTPMQFKNIHFTNQK